MQTIKTHGYHFGSDKERSYDVVTQLGGFHLVISTRLGDEVSGGGSEVENGREMGVVTLVDRGRMLDEFTL